MPTIDLSAPAPEAAGLLDSLPRRATVTLTELQLIAEHAGGAPLPFDVTEPTEAPAIENRLGASRGSNEKDAYQRAVGSLPDAASSLERRGLLTDGTADDALVGAVGLLATPEIAMDIDISAGGVQAKAWHRQAGDAVASLSTADGIVFELAWFPVSSWPAELARIPAIPEDIRLGDSQVPALLDLPYELADAAAAATNESRGELIPVLTTRHAGSVTGPEGGKLGEATLGPVLSALSTETQGRLRAMTAQVSETTSVVGVVSWVLLADGWHALRPHHDDAGTLRVEVRRVDPADLGTEIAPVLAEVTR